MSPRPPDPQFGSPPSSEDIEALARAAMETIPEALLRHVRDVVIHVAEFPDPETERDMDLETPFDLLGLYRGVALGDKNGWTVPHDVDRIFLYRRPLLDYWCESGEDLAHLIRHVIVHEIGHHFGLSDEDMDAIEAGA